MDHLGENHLHQQPNDQHKPPEGCWCNGATNLGEVKWMQQFLALIEERVEKVLDRKLNLPPNSSSLPHQAESSVSSSLQLCFKGELPEKIWTKNNIEDEEGVSLALELCNDTGEKVEEISPELENLKVKILPLDGDLKVDDRHDWTEEEFQKHVAIPRDDKPPLLKGSTEFSLKSGYARIYGISFTDNSSYMRSRKFRLGAQPIRARGLSSGGVIRPAVSEAFQVKESRVKANQKHSNPLPHDELWRLVNISKNGVVYQRAKKDNILTVLDFLQLYYTDAKKLRDILQLTGKTWEETVKNAEACDLTDELYECSYLDDASGDLEESQMEKVRKLRQAAHEKQKEPKKGHASTNQTPVQARLGYSCPTEQVAPPPPPQPPLSSVDYNVEGIWESTDLVGLSSYEICSTSTTNSQYLDNTATAQGNFEQLPACLVTGAYGVNNTCLAFDNLIQQAADDTLYWQFDPAFDFSANMQFSNFTPANQGVTDMQQVNSVDDGCTLDMHQGLNIASANDLGDLEEHFAKDLTSRSDQKMFNDSSANNPVTRKLIAACYVTKAATIFMISAQQDSTSPMKKRKRQ